jgi:hypothetical protein
MDVNRPTIPDNAQTNTLQNYIYPLSLTLMFVVSVAAAVDTN